MNLSNHGGLNLFQPLHRIKTVIAAIDEEVGHIEQQPSTRLVAQQVNEISLGNLLGKSQLRSNVLQ
ncbi:hypothetical protein SV7mr_48270 [Stieleria bergensis]|uniref:Uncharacterized protein n=1 Tax=Stieleria bergensis TaxID=2528025 RepID=A0A517T1M6_9BACT|nr:hypothetical protein SV7mr_48270 [Planctomycetes bacterium SV_7m_r]